MARNEPLPGQIVDHHYLWRRERKAGREEGAKPRPCLVAAVQEREGAAPRVMLFPITSRAPRDVDAAVAIPPTSAGALGLDQSRGAWIVVEEANVFAWPGFDLVPQLDGGFVRATVTRDLFVKVQRAAVALRSTRGIAEVNRD